MDQRSQIQTFYQYHDNYIKTTAISKHLHSKITLPGVPAADDRLTARELELGTVAGFFSMIGIAFLAVHRKEDLANVLTSTGTLRLAKTTPHSSLELIRPGTRKNPVDTKDIERVEGILPSTLGHY